MKWIGHLPLDKLHLLAEMCCSFDEMWCYNVATNAIALLSSALYIDHPYYALPSINLEHLMMPLLK